MSDSLPAASSLWRSTRGGAVLLGLWHVLCISGGCLYIAPVWSDLENGPPEIIRPLGEDDTLIPLPLVGETTVVTVIAADPEGEDITIIWDTPFLAFQDVGLVEDNGNWASTLKVPRDPAYDGQIIEAVILDQATPRNRRSKQWLVEVP